MCYKYYSEKLNEIGLSPVKAVCINWIDYEMVMEDIIASITEYSINTDINFSELFKYMSVEDFKEIIDKYLENMVDNLPENSGYYTLIDCYDVFKKYGIKFCEDIEYIMNRSDTVKLQPCTTFVVNLK